MRSRASHTYMGFWCVTSLTQRLTWRALVWQRAIRPGPRNSRPASCQAVWSALSGVCGWFASANVRDCVLVERVVESAGAETAEGRGWWLVASLDLAERQMQVAGPIR